MPTARTERVATCPACGGGHRDFVCRGRDRLYHLSDQAFSFARCRNCGSVYQFERPAESDAATYYPSHYGPYQGGAATVRADAGGPLPGPHSTVLARARRRVKHTILTSLGRLNAALARRFPDPLPGILGTVYAPTRTGQVLLDFGCGSATFLDTARARGWDTIGVDFAPAVVDAVRRAGHRTWFPVEAWANIPDASLDVVRMNHVIEHLYSPLATLEQLRRKLRQNGCLHLATPNAACLTFQVLHNRWFSLDCPRHVVLFTPRSMRRLLRLAGFGSVTCYQEVLTKDMARSLGYVLQDLGRLDDAGVMGMMDRSGIAGLLFPVARLAALACAADRFHAIARKPLAGLREKSP